MATFFTRTKKTEGTAALYVEVRKAARIVTSTLIKVDVKEWNERNDSVENLNSFFDKNSVIIMQMKEIEIALDLAAKDVNFSKADADEIIKGIVYRDAHKALAEDKARQEEEKRKKAGSPMNLLTEYIDEMKEGKRLIRGRRYADNTIADWNSFHKVFKGFYQMNPFTWENLNARLIDRFVAYLREFYMAKTVNKNITSFRTLAGYAACKGLLSLDAVRFAFSKKSVEVSIKDKKREIFLTAEEIQALYEMELTGTDAEVRDLFLVGVYTCQRVSDFTKIVAEDFRTTKRGTKVIDITQKKTRTSITIPVLNDNLLTIAKRYDFDMPYRSPSLINTRIKSILQRLSESVPSLAEKEVTILSYAEKRLESEGKMSFERNRRGDVLKPRYELAGTHTARRSGITNLYVSGRFDNFQMMRVSGHKDEKVFLEYIKLSGDDVADLIRERQQQTKDDDSIF